MLEKIFLCLLTYLIATNAFEIDEAKAEPRYQFEGRFIDFKCRSDSAYEFCIWKHGNSVCNFEWKRSAGNITMQLCSALQHRIKFIGDYNNKECYVRLYDVTEKDSGVWACEMENYVFGPARGSTASKKMSVRIIAATTTTKATTTPEILPLSEENRVTPEAGREHHPMDPEDTSNSHEIPNNGFSTEDSHLSGFSPEPELDLTYEDQQPQETEDKEIEDYDSRSIHGNSTEDGLLADSDMQPKAPGPNIIGIVLAVLSFIVLAIIAATVVVIIRGKRKSVRLEESNGEEEEKKDVELEKILKEDTTKVTFNGPSSVQFSNENKKIYQNVPLNQQ